MEDKNTLRMKFKNIRKTLPMEDLSFRIVNNIRNSDTYKNANNIMIFYPKDYEVNLLGLLSDNKNFYLPRVKAKELEVCPYKNGDELIKSHFGVYEPANMPVSPTVLDLVIAPALAVDKYKNRLGYGGGYYDRFLSKYGAHFKTIVGIPKELLIDKIPTDVFDVNICEVYFD